MHRSLLFDIESNGLLNDVTKIHCMALLDTDTGEEWSYGPDDIDKGLEDLYNADTIIGHNILAYDLPTLWKVLRWAPRPGTRRVDTLVISRLMHPNIKSEDFKRLDYPKKLIGSHSLKAWGLRLGEPKDDYEGGWSEWTPEMHTYMEQDVRTNFRLLNYLKPWEYPQVPLDLEHRVAHVCHLMENHGWTFDLEKAQKLYVTLVKRRDELEKSLVEKFGEWQEVDNVFTPKRDNKKLGYKAGVEVTKYKTVTFNPGSRRHIEKKLKELGWEPQEFTESGQAKLDEPILDKIDLPEAKELIEYLLVQKRLGQLADGDNGWIKVVGQDGCIHCYVNSGGTVTGRASHSNPNIGQVPAIKGKKGLVPYGKECRELFTVPAGWRLVGADMAGLELRTFAHYLSFYDGGDYGQVVIGEDIHTHNQKVAGLPTRDMAKTFIYALLYGAGDAKIGSIIGGSAKQGNGLKQRFFKGLPAYKKLKDRVDIACRKGYLQALDGRRLSIRSPHAALNSLLQGAGAILCKQWLADVYDELTEAGYRFGYMGAGGSGGDYVIVGWVHDEIQVACKSELVEVVGETLVRCARAAGEPFNFRIPLDSSYSSGHSWADTH
jgi:DNA polymerase I